MGCFIHFEFKWSFSDIIFTFLLIARELIDLIVEFFINLLFFEWFHPVLIEK